MWPHLTSTQFFVLIGLYACWMAPDWGFKLIALADEIKRHKHRC
jgi:hypothetical protein